jgi:hypothetical protein
LEELSSLSDLTNKRPKRRMIKKIASCAIAERVVPFKAVKARVLNAVKREEQESVRGIRLGVKREKTINIALIINH